MPLPKEGLKTEEWNSDRFQIERKISMIRIIRLKKIIPAIVAALLLTIFPAHADEMLALYGMKGYAYVWSPLISQGGYVQAGAVYSLSRGEDGMDGNSWAVPVSFTYGNGQWWEVSVATHWERWENTDLNFSESGVGDVFVGGKLRLLGTEKNMPLDISLMPYILIPTGSRDKSVIDLYQFNPSTKEDASYGLNLLLGRRWERFYISANLGINYTNSANLGISYANSDESYVKNSTFFVGLALEYQLAENLNTYVEFFNVGNKNDFGCGPCADDSADQDIRQLGVGMVWLKDLWGFKLHAGFGLSDTSPDFRIIALVNRNIF